MSSSGSATVAGSRVAVLIAEDDDGHAELIREHLQDAGIRYPMLRFRDGQEVVDFLNGTAAPAPAQRVRPDMFVLLLDIRMPRLDGIGVLRYIKGHPRHRTIPVFMLSTTDDPREVNVCYGLGCNCYVSKPVDHELFAETLRRLALFVLVSHLPVLSSPENA